MALLIGDIGGTTSRWAWASAPDRDALRLELPGYNPATGSPAAMQAALRDAAIMKEAQGGGTLYVAAYGAGCGTKDRRDRMHAAISGVWPGATVEVESDLLGAARALYGHASGLVLILGTGMNAGYYNGTELHLPMPSLGYVLGDEGSGADIGRHLLRDAFYGQVPIAVNASIFPIGPHLPEVLEQIHHGPAPQALLASFTAALAGHLHEAYVQDLVASRFLALARLLAQFFTKVERREVRAVGSVAFGFRNLLCEAMEQRGMAMAAIERDPMPGLVEYHSGRAG